jgi:hypothetical protein
MTPENARKIRTAAHIINGAIEIYGADETCKALASGLTRQNMCFSAAPDMLAALEAAHWALADLADTAGDDDRFNEGGVAYEAHEAIRSAISKAKGVRP